MCWSLNHWDVFLVFPRIDGREIEPVWLGSYWHQCGAILSYCFNPNYVIINLCVSRQVAFWHCIVSKHLRDFTSAFGSEMLWNSMISMDLIHFNLNFTVGVQWEVLMWLQVWSNSGGETSITGGQTISLELFLFWGFCLFLKVCIHSVSSTVTLVCLGNFW